MAAHLSGGTPLNAFGPPLPDPAVLSWPQLVFTPEAVRGEIVFEDVGFYYQEDKDVLDRFNLRVRPGEHIALVGPTGGGKSTIVNLLCRFYEPTSGTIRIGGRDYGELTQTAIQSRIGMVLQTPHLFSGTIEDNIRYGRLDASDEEVREAARVVHADEFISALDKGYKEIKLHAWGRPQEDAALCRALREKVGDEILLMYDASSMFNIFEDAVWFGRRLEEAGFRWYEEQMDHYNMTALARLTAELEIPLAVAEATQGGPWDAHAQIQAGAADVMIDLMDDRPDGENELLVESILDVYFGDIQSLLALETMIVNGGRRGVLVELATEALVRLLSATPADLCRA